MLGVCGLGHCLLASVLGVCILVCFSHEQKRICYGYGYGYAHAVWHTLFLVRSVESHSIGLN